jgi:hypothetical protein
VSLGRAQVPGAGGSEERPLNSRAMRMRSAGLGLLGVEDGDALARDPLRTRTSRIHWWTAVGSQKMMWPQCGLAATRLAHSISLGLS